MKKLMRSLLATCLITMLFLTGFSGNAWAYNETQFNLLKSGVAQWNQWSLDGGRGGEDVDLTGADLSGLDLTDAFLRFADLSGANLSGTNLHDADLISVNLSNANLTGANLTEASFSDTNFSGANLTNADLSGYHYAHSLVNFQGANLSGANLNSDDLVGCDVRTYRDRYQCDRDHPELNLVVNFYGASYNENTQFPPDVNGELAVTAAKKKVDYYRRYRY